MTGAATAGAPGPGLLSGWARATVETMNGVAGESEAAGAPWETPVVDLPDRVTAKWCAQTLTTPAGDAIVRSHLEPRSEDRRYRVTFERLWRSIAFDARWRRIVTDMLTADREQAQRALDGGLNGKAATRARTYVHQVGRALQRLDREAAGPLAWASASYAGSPERERAALEALALTVDEYLHGTATRADLGAVLDGLDLNPAGRDVPTEARARAASNRIRR